MVKIVKIIGVLTSGGDAPGMNVAIHAVVRMAINKGLRVKGIMRGYTGLLEGKIMDMEPTSVSNIISRGSTIFYTARCKEFTTPEGQQKDAEVCRKHGIGDMIVIGGGGSFRGTGKLPSFGISTIGLPGAIDLNIAYTDYTIGPDTAMNTAIEAIDKIHDASISHERCNTVEVTGGNADYIALWCGTANETEGALLPERYNGGEQALINKVTDNRRRGKKRNIITNVEGIGRSGSMTERTEAATGIETRATILGHMQRDDVPTCKDRIYTSIVGAKAAELLAEGKDSRLVAYKHGEFVDHDIQEALNMSKDIPEE